MSSQPNSQNADTSSDPEIGVRNRSEHSKRVHRIDPDSDDLQPACCRKHEDAEFKRCDIERLTAFRRFSRCQNPECFGKDRDAENDETELIADGGFETTGHYERGDGPFPSAYPGIGVGAVLYEDRPDTPDDERRLHHVTDIRISIESTDVYYVVQDGTHTTWQQYHEEDLLADFEPAGWRWPASRKPTYWLTRQCGVDDQMDRMTDGGSQQLESELYRESRERTINGTTVRLTVEVEPDGELEAVSRKKLPEFVLTHGLEAEHLRWDTDPDRSGGGR